MFKDIEYNRFGVEIDKILKSGGAFLTTKGDRINTMVIGWGGTNIIWGKPIFMVMVRDSRHTYDLIEKAGEFTVSFPVERNLKSALSFCGTKSGKDFDKLKECKLTPVPAKVIDTPVIGECSLHYECKIVYKQEMKIDDSFNEGIHNKFYQQHNNYHTFYFGEIVACYASEDILQKK